MIQGKIGNRSFVRSGQGDSIKAKGLAARIEPPITYGVIVEVIFRHLINYEMQVR